MVAAPVKVPEKKAPVAVAAAPVKVEEKPKTSTK